MSMDNPTINRYLTDKALDRMDHALGRPMWPLKETYRNHYAIGIESMMAAEFAWSPHWNFDGVSDCGMAYFSVTDAGRQALAAWLKEHDPHRAYQITFEGHSWVVPAKSRGKAKYEAWLKISDSWSELTFGQFLRDARVRVI